MITLNSIIDKVVDEAVSKGKCLKTLHGNYGTPKEIVETLESLGWEINYTECESWVGNFDFCLAKGTLLLNYHGCWYFGEQKILVRNIVKGGGYV